MSISTTSNPLIIMDGLAEILKWKIEKIGEFFHYVLFATNFHFEDLRIWILIMKIDK